MAPLGRARHPAFPQEAARVLDLGPKDRVLAWSPLIGGGVAAATPAGLRILTARGRVVTKDWTEVDHAAWDAESGALAIWWVGSRQATPLELEDQSRLPDVVHQRVQASVVLATDVVVPGGRRVWVALRKGHDGTLSTQAVPAPGVDLDDEHVAPVIARAFRALRDEAGL